MVAVDCPICRSSCTRSVKAKVATFIAERAQIESLEARSHFCDSCEHVFLTPFLTPEQLTRIYTGYRGADYNVSRDSHEPGYLAMAPELADPCSHGYALRREYYDYFLSSFNQFRGFVVDYGGGDGYFSKYVFPNAGVIVADEDFERSGGDLNSILERADFMTAMHVFEHVPNPFETLSRLTSRLRCGTPIYIELPRSYSGSLSKVFAEMESIDSTGSSVTASDLVILHEHISHFSKKSAQVLMERCSIRCSEFYLHGAGIMGFLGEKIAAP